MGTNFSLAVGLNGTNVAVGFVLVFGKSSLCICLIRLGRTIVPEKNMPSRGLVA